MPTITNQTTRPPVPGAATKAAPSVLGLGEPGVPFAAMLEGSGDEAGSPSLAPRQVIAVPGTALPLPIEPPPAPETLRTDDPGAAPIAAGLENPFVLDRLPDTGPVPTAPLPSTSAAPSATEEAGDTEIIEVPPLAIAATVPTPSQPIIIPYTAVPLPAVSATGGAKASPLPSISVARGPGTSARATPASVAPPQIGRDMQWSAAPMSPSPTQAAVATTAPNIVTPGPTVAPIVAPAVGSPDQPIAPVPVPDAPAIAAASKDRLDISRVPDAPATPLPVTPALLAGPALQVFGAALAAAAKRDLADRMAPELGTAGIAGAAPAPLLAGGIAATDASGQPLLDMRQERWPQAMIAHIEQLRDAADAVDTRIRLIPDALGTIDVAVSRDGDTLNVHFAAEQAATRLLLQDAQPRLAAIAEERGLRIGQTAVDANTASSTPQQQQRQPHAQSQPQRDAAAARRPTTTHDDNDRADSGRLA